MAKVHDIVDIWQGSQNLGATQGEFSAQNKQRKTRGWISDTGENVKASSHRFHHDGAAAFELSDRSSLPSVLSAMYLHGGRTQILNLWWIRRIDCHRVESYEDSAALNISKSEKWHHWNGDQDYTSDKETNWAADVECDIRQDNAIQEPECPQKRDVSAVPKVPGLIQHTWKLKRTAENVLVRGNAIETRRIEEVQKQ